MDEATMTKVQEIMGGQPRSDGFGIGLSVCRRLVTRIYGSPPKVRSEVSGMTEFSFVIPDLKPLFSDAVAWEVPSWTAPPQRLLDAEGNTYRPSVLLVDDELSQREGLARWFSHFAEVRQAESGLQALEIGEPGVHIINASNNFYIAKYRSKFLSSPWQL